MNDIVLYQEIGLIAKAVTRIAKIIRDTQMYPRRDAEMLRIQIEATLTAHRASATGDMARQNIDEIVRTFRKIELFNLTGTALQQCSAQLEILSAALERNLNEFIRRIM